MTDTMPRDSAVEAHDTTSADQGGSPPSGDRVVGADGEPIEDEVEEQEEPAAPEAPVPDARVAELEAELNDARALFAELDDRLASDPELAQRLNGGPQKAAEDVYEAFESVIRDPEAGLNAESGDILLRALKPVLGRLKQLEDEQRTMQPRLQHIAKAIGSNEFTRQLAERGVAGDVQKSSEFGKHLRGMRGDREFKSLEAKSPGYAARVAADAWLAKKAQTNGFRDDRERLGAAKAGRASGAQRGSGLVEKIHELVRDGSEITRAHQLRLDAQAAGDPPPKIRYVRR